MLILIMRGPPPPAPTFASRGRDEKRAQGPASRGQGSMDSYSLIRYVQVGQEVDTSLEDPRDELLSACSGGLQHIFTHLHLS